MESATITPESPRAGLRRTTPIVLLGTIVPIAGNVFMIIVGPFVAVAMRGTGAVGAMWFAIGYAILGALAIAPTYTTSLVAGWAFGVKLGFAAVLFGTTIGATVCYLFARRFGSQRVIDAFKDHDRMETIRRALVEESPLKTLWIVFLLRLSPILPFGTTNILLATTGVRYGTFLLGTILGIIPRIGAILFAAAGANQLDFKRQQSWWILAGGIAATIVCVALMAIIGKRALDRATNQTDSPQRRRERGGAPD